MVAASPARLNAQVVVPAEALELSAKGSHLFARVGIVLREWDQNADALDLLCLLRARREWPCHGPAREQGNEIPSLHVHPHEGRAVCNP